MKNEKVYIVQTMDEWNNVLFIGVFDDLKKAERTIKEDFSTMNGIESLELKEYASTFSTCFDTELYDEDTGGYLRVFGYIIEAQVEKNKYEEKYMKVGIN